MALSRAIAQLLSGVLLLVQLGVVQLRSATEIVESRTFPALAGDTLVVVNDYGRVQIRVWERASVRADIRKIASSEDALDRVAVGAEKKGTRIAFRSDFHDRTTQMVVLEIQMPRHMRVIVWTADASVDLRGMEGPVRVHTESGLIAATDLVGSSNLLTESGSVLLEARRQPEGDLKIESLSGDVRCTVGNDLNVRSWARAGGTLFWNRESPLQAASLERSFGTGGPLLYLVSVEGNVQVDVDGTPTPSDGSAPEATAASPGDSPAPVVPPGRTEETTTPPARPERAPVLVRDNTRDLDPPDAAGTSSDAAEAHPRDRSEASAPGIGADGNVSFRIDVDWVYLNVAVRDRVTNRSVPGLQRDDFLIYEDNVQQQVKRFEPSEAPIHLLLLLDVSGSTREFIGLIREASIEFIQQIKANDSIAVAAFNSNVALVADFSNDRNRAASAIRRLRPRGGTAFYDALYASITDYMGHIEGRKAIVVFTDGEDNRLTGDRANGSAISFPKLYREIQEIDSIVYTIFLDSGGLGSQTSSSTGRVIQILGDILGRRVPGPSRRRGGSNPPREVYEEAKRQMQMIADQTGGRMYRPRRVDDLFHVYREIADDLRIQYTLAYNSSNPARDGSWREIRVRMIPGNLAARARKGYYARTD